LRTIRLAAAMIFLTFRGAFEGAMALPSTTRAFFGGAS
jgi:hypothetical protein